MRIGIDMGHTLSGVDYGAEGLLKEAQCNRDIGAHLKKLLLSLGNEVIDCTIDYASSVNESLSKRVNLANGQNLDLFISIHLNSGGGHGAETYIVARGGRAEKFAGKVQTKLVELGYKDRGVKTANFYVLKNTTAPAILIECGFVDSEEDSNRYNAHNIAKAIAEGITEQVTVINKKYYVVTNYLERDSKGYVEMEPIVALFKDIRFYLKYNDKGIWIETQYLDYSKCLELKNRLESLFWSIKEE